MPPNTLEDTLKRANKIGMVKYQGQAKQLCFVETQLVNLFRDIEEATIKRTREEILQSVQEFVTHNAKTMESDRNKLSEYVDIRDLLKALSPNNSI
jgi:hypothetical protein